MQQKLSCRGSASFLLGGLGSAPCERPFRCPRCGDPERFGSLASLRAHLEYHHAYPPPPDPPDPPTFSITGKPPDPLSAAILWNDTSLPVRRGQQRPPPTRSLSDAADPAHNAAARRRTQSVGVGTQDEEGEGLEEGGGTQDEAEDQEDGRRNQKDVKDSPRQQSGLHLFNHQASLLPLDQHQDQDQDPDQDLIGHHSCCGAEASAAVQRRLAGVLRAADSTVQRRLARLSSDLAHTDTELLCERAHRHNLAQEAQEAARRRAGLSRQVDVAVMVIAALREQLNASEGELERREREAITIQRFLQAAVRQETCGKVRIQNFIEGLLTRIALTERLVEFYQDHKSPGQGLQQQPEISPPRTTKSRSAGGHQPSSRLHDNMTQSSRPGGGGGGGGGDLRERLAQSSRLFCRPEHRDDIWNQRRSTGYQD